MKVEEFPVIVWITEREDVPPLIVEYDSGIFRVNDGRHRLEMYRQLGVESAYAVLWATGEKNYKELLGRLTSG